MFNPLLGDIYYTNDFTDFLQGSGIETNNIAI